MFGRFRKIAGFAGQALTYACVAHCTFEYVGDMVICSGPSMEPTLFSNNILITDKISTRRGLIERGDVIIARNPSNPQQFICKRIAGMPGDTIVLHSAYSLNPFGSHRSSSSVAPPPSSGVERVAPNSTLQRAASTAAERLMTSDIAFTSDDYNDGKSLDDLDPDAIENMKQRAFRTNVFVVPGGHVWLEGDNASNSLDSRQYGPIPLGLVRSRAVAKIWPLTEMCLLSQRDERSLK